MLTAGCGGRDKAETATVSSAQPAPAVPVASPAAEPPAGNVAAQTASVPSAVFEAGAEIYGMNCAQCHTTGEGDADRPPLIDAPGTTGPAERTIRAVLKGVSGPLEVRGRTYNGIMPAQDWLSDEEVSAVVTYVRQKFGARSDLVAPADVARVRAGQ